jgi:hypothetical protein
MGNGSVATCRRDRRTKFGSANCLENMFEQTLRAQKTARRALGSEDHDD